MNVMKTSKQAGQNLVEFSLVVTLLLIFILVIVDLGRITFYYSVLHNATREGARYGVVHPTDLAGAETFAEDFAHGLSKDPAILDVTASLQDGGDTFQVAATYRFRPVTPILTWILNSGGNSFILNSVSRMRIEQ
jgi:Flp pilus assembly protein TadG